METLSDYIFIAITIIFIIGRYSNLFLFDPWSVFFFNLKFDGDKCFCLERKW